MFVVHELMAFTPGFVRSTRRLSVYIRKYMSSSHDSLQSSSERNQELQEALIDIRQRVTASSPGRKPTLIAVSKYKSASDVLACYRHSHFDFGENYVQELIEKASLLPPEIRWHFIGTLQSKKAKALASIPNLYCVQTLTSAKAAAALNKAISTDRVTPLRVLLQVNTSGEDNKSGLAPLSPNVDATSSELYQLASYVITECPRLHLEGLMTIGTLEQSLAASETEKNMDFERLRETRDILREYLVNKHAGTLWGQEATGSLVLSMGMSSDFETALKNGADIVRIGTGIFGQRSKKSL